MVEIKTEYNGFDITYSEWNNTWELNGYDKRFDSLALAKEYIDKQNKVEFKRFKVWVSGYRDIDRFTEGMVTSFDGQKYWVTTKNGRQTHEPNKVIVDSPDNCLLMGEIVSLEQQARALSKQADEKSKLLTTLAKAEGK